MGTHPIFESDFDCLTDCEKEKKNVNHFEKTCQLRIRANGRERNFRNCWYWTNFQKRLNDKGFEYAYNLLGQFLLLNKDEETFQEWLKDEAEMNSKYAKDVSNCISEWTRSYV